MSGKRTAIRRKHPVRPRAGRSDGQITRGHILDVAGRIFGERGFALVTSKEICAQARTNVAAVNYHFGGIDGLYEAVLVEAHRQLIDIDELTAATSAPASAAARLSRVLGMILDHASAKDGWAFPVLLREILNPSPFLPALVLKAVRPKVNALLGLLAELMELPPEHPSVQRSVLLCIVPSIFMAVAPPIVKSKLLPALSHDRDALVAEMTRFIVAGTAAIRRSIPKPPRR